MNTTDLTDGMVLRLDRDVTNPKPDRRSSHNWLKRPVWRAGTKFVVRATRRIELSTGDTIPAVMTLEPMVRFGSLYAVDSLKLPDAYALLIGHLTPVEATLDSIIRQADANPWGYEHALRVLLKEHRISLDDVRHALTVEVDDSEKAPL